WVIGDVASIAHALGLVIVRRIPFELADKIEQALLLSARNEFVEGLGDHSILRALAADFQGESNEFGIYRQIDRHAYFSKRRMAHSGRVAMGRQISARPVDPLVAPCIQWAPLSGSRPSRAPPRGREASPK